ncbi:TPA: oxidoreductase [Pseudomonas aeruginosa]|nr:oxidoreductase [Pseudomonas aeruginosa]
MQQLNTLGTLARKTLDERAYEVAARHALNADQHAVLAWEVVDALTAAGFARYFVPCEKGGQPGTFSDLSQRVAKLAEACPSAAWCATIQAVVGRMAAYLPPQAQREIWGDTQDVRICASFRSTGKVEATEGGWRLNGSWHYLSGIDFADWALLCIEGEDGEQRFAAIPAGTWKVVNDWQTLGMRGTGSRSIDLHGVVVPAHMTFLRADLLKGGSRHAHGPQYQASPIAADAQLFLACGLGAARDCLGHWQAGLPTEASGEAAMAYASAECALQVCGLLLRNSCETIDQGELAPVQVARCARDAAFAAQLLLDAVNRIFRLSGAQGHYSNSPVQKSWRDVQTLTSHIALRPDFNFIGYARQALADKPRGLFTRKHEQG